MTRSVAMIALSCCLLAASAANALPKQAAQSLKRLAKQLKCAKGNRNGQRIWCIGAEFLNGRRAKLGEGVWFGLTTLLKDQGSIDKAPTAASVLVVTKRSGKRVGNFTMLRPSNPNERAEMQTLLRAAKTILRAGQGAVALPKSLRGPIGQMRARAKMPISRRGRSWQVGSKAELRAVGKFVVLVGIAEPSATIVSLLVPASPGKK